MTGRNPPGDSCLSCLDHHYKPNAFGEGLSVNPESWNATGFCKAETSPLNCSDHDCSDCNECVPCNLVAPEETAAGKWYTHSENRTQCEMQDCTAGFYCEGGKTGRTRCPAGKFLATTGGASVQDCIDCIDTTEGQPGNYAPEPGSTSCDNICNANDCGFPGCFVSEDGTQCTPIAL